MSALTDLTASIAMNMGSLNSAILSAQNQANGVTAQLATLAGMISSDPATVLQTQLTDLNALVAADTAALTKAAQSLAAAAQGPTGP